ncbi:helix-turn-helix domain-containing protein, partial [Enterococcus casseliflavus]|uniref:helix-turn-helix domain-containing protein n=1 Tax=Enterococcus casseliflavus TaxID=37734 RepID=UPI00232DDD18
MINILKEKRLEKGMTLEEVGNLVGVGKSTVRKWENGMIENMGRDKIIKLSNALSISPLAILGIDEPNQEPNQESNLKSNYRII